MVKRFSDGSKNDSRALQIWQILIAAAHNRQIVTYKILAKILGYGGSGVFGQPLGHIAYFCNQNRLPPLTCLVVNEKTGRPGKGIPVNKVSSKREKVFNYPWFDIIPPSRIELRQAYVKKGKS